jgi:hypothetical protein
MSEERCFNCRAPVESLTASRASYTGRPLCDRCASPAPAYRFGGQSVGPRVMTDRELRDLDRWLARHPVPDDEPVRPGTFNTWARSSSGGYEDRGASGGAEVRFWHDDEPVYGPEPDGVPREERGYSGRWWVRGWDSRAADALPRVYGFESAS